MDHVETKMGEYASTINILIDAHDTKEKERETVKAKISDIEDRSRRDNLKIRGVSESIQQSEPRNYVAQVFTSILPDLTELDVTVGGVGHTHIKDYYTASILAQLKGWLNPSLTTLWATLEQQQIPGGNLYDYLVSGLFLPRSSHAIGPTIQASMDA